MPVDGEPFAAELVAADAKWQLTFDAGDKPRTLAAGDLVSWGACPEPARAPILVLADGGLIVADVPGRRQGVLAAESDLLGTLKLPLDSLAGIVFHLPAGRQDRDLLVDRVAQAPGRSDRLLLDNGDEVTGLVESIPERQGAARGRGRTGRDRNAADRRRRVQPLDPEGAAGLSQFSFDENGTVPLAPLHAWVGLSDGSRVLTPRS